MKTNFTLLEFMRDFEYNDNLFWKKKAEEQLIFVRDTIGTLVKSPIFIVSTHYSKSCLLPVYGFMLPNGIRVIMRENFYGWVVSMWVDNECASFSIDEGLVHGDRDENEGYNGDIKECYCEGFKSEWVFPFQTKDIKATTFRVDGDFELYALLYKIINEYNNEIPFVVYELDTEQIKNIYNSIIECHPSLNRFYDVFPETYNKATNYDFAKKHSLSIFPENDELFKTISEFQEIKECFLKEYYRFNFFEKFDSSDSTDKLENIRGTFAKERER